MPLPTEPIGEEPKTCCGELRNTPFCVVCGKRLTINEFIGTTEAQLTYDIDFVSNDYRHAEARVRELQRKHEQELEPATEAMTKLSRKCTRMREAIDYARRNNVGR